MTVDFNRLGILDGKVQNYITADNVRLPSELLRDEQSTLEGQGRETVRYLFSEVGSRAGDAGTAESVVRVLDHWGIEVAQLDVGLRDAPALCDALAPWSDRFAVSARIDPHGGVAELRRLQSVSTQYRTVRSACIYPLTTWPPIPANAKECYPIYAKCIELGLPVFVTVGIPGPRVPSHTQHPMALDEVCWFFPDLTVVMMHGGEPWVDLCVKLLLKWPNLYYMTSGFAPKHYPQQIIELLNTRGKDKVVFGGYWPTLSYDRIFAELAKLPIREEVWELFLRHNGRKILGLDEAS